MPKPEDEVSEMFAWEWNPCASRDASSLMDKPLEEPGVWITNHSYEMSRWRWEIETLFCRFSRRSRGLPRVKTNAEQSICEIDEGAIEAEDCFQPVQD
jgi:hypothetical protein